MKLSKRFRALTVAATCVAFLSAVVTVAAETPPRAGALSPVASADPKAPGLVEPNILSVELQEVALAQGATHYENPTPAARRYGYLNNGPHVPLPTAPAVEATKTEPDKDTYLVFLGGLRGADPAYRYGSHFLFQGHEAGSPGQMTRLDLDADGALARPGRDPSATIDSALQGTPGFQNDGDNEITGLHVSDGDPGPNGLLGAKVPDTFNGRWRVVYTQQHGDNVTWEVVPANVRQVEAAQGQRFDRERGP